MKDNYFQIQKLLQLMIVEGNNKKGEHKGYKWEINRVAHSGHLCGYIYLDEATEKEFEIINSNFHGGVTWGDEEEPFRGKYGFDCAHCYDLRPLELFAGMDTVEDMEYRTMEYVEECLKNTIDLLVENKKEEKKITNSEEAEKHFSGSWVVSGDSEIIIKTSK